MLCLNNILKYVVDIIKGKHKHKQRFANYLEKIASTTQISTASKSHAKNIDMTRQMCVFMLIMSIVHANVTSANRKNNLNAHA